MVRSFSSFRCLLIAASVLLTGAGDRCCVCAQAPGVSGEQAWSGYQRERHDMREWRRDRRNNSYFQGPTVSSGWFQRPYPYHLDYYRMKYGGSYAPYFGNLYGPPQVVTAPPYFGPYYGNFDYASPYGLNTPVPFAQPSYENLPSGDGTIDGTPRSGGAATESGGNDVGETLPAGSP